MLLPAQILSVWSFCLRGTLQLQFNLDIEETGAQEEIQAWRRSFSQPLTIEVVCYVWTSCSTATRSEQAREEGGQC